MQVGFCTAGANPAVSILAHLTVHHGTPAIFLSQGLTLWAVAYKRLPLLVNPIAKVTIVIVFFVHRLVAFGSGIVRLPTLFTDCRAASGAVYEILTVGAVDGFVSQINYLITVYFDAVHQVFPVFGNSCAVLKAKVFLNSVRIKNQLYLLPAELATARGGRTYYVFVPELLQNEGLVRLTQTQHAEFVRTLWKSQQVAREIHCFSLAFFYRIHLILRLQIRYVIWLLRWEVNLEESLLLVAVI